MGRAREERKRAKPDTCRRNALPSAPLTPPLMELTEGILQHEPDVVGHVNALPRIIARIAKRIIAKIASWWLRTNRRLCVQIIVVGGWVGGWWGGGGGGGDGKGDRCVGGGGVKVG